MGWLRYEEGLAVYIVFSISNSMRDRQTSKYDERILAIYIVKSEI